MKIGFAIADITPELGIYLTGYGTPQRLAESIHSPLEATVAVMQEDDKTASVINLDWCYISMDLVPVICKGISETAGIAEENILLSCSHTHSAPHTGHIHSFGRLHIDPEEKGIQYVYDKIPDIAGAVKQAKENLKEVKAGFTVTQTKTGVSRRGTDENGKVKNFIEDPYQICDSNMTVSRFLDRETNEDLGIIIHASCHNTCMGAGKVISSDWCGVMKRRVSSRYNDVPVLFLNGGFGDVGPRTNRYMADPGAFAAGGGDGELSVNEVGSRAAFDALRALEEIRDFRSDLPLLLHTDELRVPLKPGLTLKEVEEIMENYSGDPERKKDREFAKSFYDALQNAPQTEKILRRTILAFGPVAIVPFPYEMFSVFSLRLRKYGPFPYTLLTGNTNGYLSYMPDKGAFAAGGYEAGTINSFTPFVITEDAGDHLIVQSLASLRKMVK